MVDTLKEWLSGDVDCEVIEWNVSPINEMAASIQKGINDILSDRKIRWIRRYYWMCGIDDELNEAVNLWQARRLQEAGFYRKAGIRKAPARLRLHAAEMLNIAIQDHLSRIQEQVTEINRNYYDEQND